MSKVNISPQIKPGKLPKYTPVGLGGWFTLVIIGLFGTILMDILSMFEVFPIDISNVNIFYFVIYLICIVNEVILSVVILALIFLRKIMFRNLYLIQTCVLGACFIVMLEGSSLVALLARILWTVYLYRSERVKNTFFGIKSINQTLSETENSLS
jgi:drug/metabolite transporter (DMT)-like permease